MTTDENKSEELKEDSQPDENAQNVDHKVAKRKGLGWLNTILLLSPVIVLAGIFLLSWCLETFFNSSLDEITFDPFFPFVVLFLSSILVSFFIYYSKVSKVKSYLHAVMYAIISWMIVGCCPCGVVSPAMLNSHRCALENRFKLTLRALNEAQQTFAERNNGKYGTWQEMIDQGFIENQYSKENINVHYVISSFIVHNPSESERALGESSSFTIIAIPKTTKKKLFTFAIGVESYPLVWVGDPEDWSTVNVSLHNIKLWEPLR